MPTLRKEGQVISWKNNKSADVAKGQLVHIGKGLFGVTVNAIADDATGQVLISGVFDGGTATNAAAIGIGAAIELDSETALATLTVAEATVTAVGTISNMRAVKDYTAASTVTEFQLVG